MKNHRCNMSLCQNLNWVSNVEWLHDLVSNPHTLKDLINAW